MNHVKLIIINKGDYNSAVKKINNYFGEYDNRYIRLNMKQLKETISDGLDYTKDALFDKIEQNILKEVLITGFNVILVAIDRPNSYYKNIEKLVNGYRHIININIEYREINKKENIFKRLFQRIKEI